VAQSDIGHLALHQILMRGDFVRSLYSNLASDNVAKSSREIKRNFGSTNRNISLMIGLASPYTVHRRARLRCAEINPNPCNGPSRKATGGR
jgi:hypothetical protein